MFNLVAANPKLMNEPYGNLDMLAVMKHFPTLSSSYVKDQWNNFKRYDSDGNGELDMSEVRCVRAYMNGQTI